MKRWMVVLGLLLAVGLLALLASRDERSVHRGPPAYDPPALDTRAEEAAPALAGQVTDPALLWSLVVTVEDDETGEPLEGEDVQIEFWTQDSPTYARVTDAEGRVRFGPYSSPFLMGGLWLVVRCTARDASSGLVEALPAEGGLRELHVSARLVRSAIVEGRVLLPPGVPAEAARLWMRRGEGPLIDHYGSLDGCERVPLTPTGRFRQPIGEPQALEWLVAVTHESKRWFGRGVTTGAPLEHVELALSDLCPGDIALMRMHVRSPDGQLVSASFWDRWVNGDIVGHGVSIDGQEEHERWFLWQPGGEFYVQARHVESEEFGHVALGAISMDVTDVEITLPPERVLRGVVRTLKGKPVAGVKVRARIVQLTSAGRDIGWMDEGAVTDASGRYEIHGLGRLTYLVTATVTTSPGTTRPHTITAGQEKLDFIVRPTVSAQVRILDAGGAPVAGAIVSVDLPPAGVTLDPEQLPLVEWSVPGEFQEVASGVLSTEDGSLVIDGLVDGRLYRIVIDPAGNRPEIGSKEVQGWRAGDTTFRLPQGAVISGRVLNAQGNPGSHLRLSARSVDGSGAGGRRYRVFGGGEVVEHPTDVTGEDGTFLIGALPAGRYELRVDGGAESIVVPAGATGVVLRIESRSDEVGSVRFRITNWQFEDRGAWALLSFGDDHPSREQVDPAGIVQFDHVPDFHRCELWIGGLEGGRYVWARNIKPPPDDEWDAIDVRVETGATVRGRVVPPTGVRLDTWSVAPVAPVLRRDHRGGVMGGLPCRQDGAGLTFELSGVPPGIWTFRVEGRSGGVTYRGEASGSAGDEVVVKLRQ